MRCISQWQLRCRHIAKFQPSYPDQCLVNTRNTDNVFPHWPRRRAWRTERSRDETEDKWVDNLWWIFWCHCLWMHGKGTIMTIIITDDGNVCIINKLIIVINSRTDIFFSLSIMTFISMTLIIKRSSGARFLHVIHVPGAEFAVSHWTIFEYANWLSMQFTRRSFLVFLSAYKSYYSHHNCNNF